MAEDILVKEQLTEKMIKVGEYLLERLKSSALSITGAFWLYELERNEWQLMLVSPDRDSNGPREVFAQIQEVLEKEARRLEGLRLTNIGLLSPNDPLPKAIDSLPFLFLVDRRMTRVWFKDAYAEDMYLYFFKDKDLQIQSDDDAPVKIRRKAHRD